MIKESIECGKNRSALTVRVLAAGLALISFGLFSLCAAYQWNYLISPSWDQGIFTQMFDAYAKLKSPIVLIKGENFNLWGDHFHPLLMLITPIYTLFPNGLTVLLMQAGLFALSVYPVACLAISRLGKPIGILLSLSYFLAWGLQSAAIAQFHEIALAVPLLAFGIAALIENHYRKATFCFSLLVFVKEDLGITVLVLALVMYLVARRSSEDWQKKAKKIVFFLVVWAISWFGIAVLVILPYFNPKGRYDYTSQVASQSIFQTLFIGFDSKILLVCVLILTIGIWGLRSPLVLALLPTLAWRFTANVPNYWGLNWQYSAVLMPIAIFALLDALWVKSLQLVNESVNGKNCSTKMTKIGGFKKTSMCFAYLTVGFSLIVNGVLVVNGAYYQGLQAWLSGAKISWQPIPDNLKPLQKQIMELEMQVGRRLKIATDISLPAYLVRFGDIYWLGNTKTRPDIAVYTSAWRDTYAPYLQKQFPGKWHEQLVGEQVFMAVSEDLANILPGKFMVRK